ncbi:MAG: hypothetical protein M3Y13_05315 [Armatimonadota bacterium]|nr:hypothetical protein [Armatimonadota bacterium]
MKNSRRPALHDTYASALFLLVSACALAGCGHKDTLVGKWQGTTTTQQGSTMNTTFEFTPDGKENLGIQGSMGAMSIAMSAVGTYTVSSNNLTQTITSVTVGSKTMPVPAAQAKPQTGAFTVDGDHLTLTNPGNHQSVTLTRVKE